jgi:hypothetical protein
MNYTTGARLIATGLVLSGAPYLLAQAPVPKTDAAAGPPPPLSPYLNQFRTKPAVNYYLGVAPLERRPTSADPLPGAQRSPGSPPVTLGAPAPHGLESGYAAQFMNLAPYYNIGGSSVHANAKRR